MERTKKKRRERESERERVGREKKGREKAFEQDTLKGKKKVN